MKIIGTCARCGTSCRHVVATSANNLGRLLAGRGRYPEAEDLIRRALCLQQGLATRFPVAPAYQRDLATVFETLASLLSVTDRLSEAADTYRLALAADETLVTGFPEVVRYRRQTAAHAGRANDLARRLATGPDPQGHDPARALDLAARVVELAPQNAGHWNTLGIGRYRTRAWKAAVTALQRSIRLDGTVSGANAFFLAMAHWQLGDEEQARQWYDQGVAWMRENNPNAAELRRFRAEAAGLLGLDSAPP